MSRLDTAAERLAAAIQAIENKIENKSRAVPEDPAATARLAALEGERETLLARIAALEEELAYLSGLTEEVEGRLEGAIGEIRTALAR